MTTLKKYQGKSVELKITMPKDNRAKIAEGTRALANLRVLVGIPGEGAERGEAVNNAMLGYIHEFGSPAANIPARPFLIPGVKSMQERIAEMFKNAGRLALAGRVADAMAQLDTLGLKVAAAVKARIVGQVGFVPLKPGTLASRRRAGFQGTKALIRTGQMLNSITYVIRKD